MPIDYHRYFIELYPKEETPVPRNREAALRREQAADYIHHINEWLRREALESKVASIAITAMGQVQIICDEDIINQLRNDDEPHIATIRNGATFVESMSRWVDK